MKRIAHPASPARLHAIRHAFALGLFATLIQAPLCAAEPESASTEKETSASTPTSATAPVAAETTSDAPIQLDDYVVTAVSRPDKSKFQSSVSVSTLEFEKISLSVPRSTAEVFRSIPGVRSEATSGEGNANLTARGVPISAGGSTYIQIHEDGLPVVEFGDMSFGTADTFFRADSTVANIETVRGGSASTFASNSPAGVINLISKTGTSAGGSIGITKGVDFDQNRVDFDYGTPINPDLRFAVGGFFRNGEGVRKTGTSTNGGQIKLNVTKDFKGGYIRLYLKRLDDTGPSYLPAPTLVSGSASNPSLGSLPGYDVHYGSPYSAYAASDLAMDGTGNPVRKVIHGIHATVNTIGGEVNLSPNEDLSITDRFRTSKNSAFWGAPFPALVDSAQSVANQIAGEGATLWWATGPNAGSQITTPSTLNGNGLLAIYHIFNTDVHAMDWTGNDLKVNKFIHLESGAKFDLTAGYYKSQQKIVMDWLWTAYLQDVRGEDSARINVRNASGVDYTDAGEISYSAYLWGNFARGYNLAYDVDAPYAQVSFQHKKFSIDASVRSDHVRARGEYANGVVRSYDMNGDGAISHAEQTVSFLDWAHANPVKYNVSYTSYSTGLNYSFRKDFALFARYSEGGRAKADREIGGSDILASGDKASAKAVYNQIKQAEIGTKYRTTRLVPGTLSLFATLFAAQTTESGFEATTQTVRSGVYKGKGVEFESVYTNHGFSLRGSVTYTHARIDSGAGANNGHIPRRQADWIYQIEPSYNYKGMSIGFTAIGTTKAYFQDTNDLVMPGYTYVNGFFGYELTKGLTLTLGVNNLFNDTGFSEAEEGSIASTANGLNVIRARTIPGRSTSVSLRYAF